MKSFVIFAVFFVVGCSAQQRSCRTANGGQGVCKSLYDCQPLMVLVNKKDRTPQDVDVLKRSHCGFDGSAPAVCCPGSNEPPAPAHPQCFTPEGKQGECISLYKCPGLLNLLQPPVPTDKFDFVQNSKCSGPDQYNVCCGPVPDFKTAAVADDCASTVSAFPPDPRTKCCGVDSRLGSKIIGGEITEVDQYPWLVLIEYQKNGVIKTLCGGALISGRYVLTAAHCVIGKVLKSGTPVAVRLGEYDTSHEGKDCKKVEGQGEACTDGMIKVPIESSIPHPQYNPQSSQNRNDIALIRLTRMAPFTDYIRPICLPTIDVTLKTPPFNMTAAGWGAVSTIQNFSPVKLEVDLPFVEKTRCQPVYNVVGRKVDLWKGQLCAGGLRGKDTCKGDSGGPLMFRNKKIYEAAGIVSFGHIECGIENIPAVYTNVFEYNTWIRNNITP